MGTPWHSFDFVKTLKCEITMHSTEIRNSVKENKMQEKRWP